MNQKALLFTLQGRCRLSRSPTKEANPPNLLLPKLTPTHMSSFSPRHRKPLTDITSPSNPYIKPVRQVAESILNLPICGEMTAQALGSFPLSKHPMGRQLWLILESSTEVQRDLSFISIQIWFKMAHQLPAHLTSFHLGSDFISYNSQDGHRTKNPTRHLATYLQTFNFVRILKADVGSEAHEECEE